MSDANPGSPLDAPLRDASEGGPGPLETFPEREPRRPPNNLPLELSSFVGRGKELAEAKRLLYDNRLVMLTGSGGCGKTRLALVAAGELAGGFEHGVWFVELASLADSSLVQGAVASALGVREQPSSPSIEPSRVTYGPRRCSWFS